MKAAIATTQLHSYVRSAVLLFIWSSAFTACGTRDNSTPPASVTPRATDIKAEENLNEKKIADDIEKAKEEKDQGQKQIDDLQKSIDSLSKDLSTNKDMSEADRKDLQAKIDEAQKSKTSLEDKLNATEEKQNALAKELESAKKANEELARKASQPAQVIVVQQPTPAPAPEPTPVPAAPASSATTIANGSRYALTFGSDCMDVAGASTAVSARIIAYPCSFQANQLFRFELAATATFRIIAENSKLCLYIYGASVNDGMPLEQQTCRRNGDSSELFQLSGTNISGVKIRNVRSGLCLKILADGKIVQSNCTTNYTTFAMKPL